MNTMLTYNTNSKTGPVCGGRACASIYNELPHKLIGGFGMFFLAILWLAG